MKVKRNRHGTAPIKADEETLCGAWEDMVETVESTGSMEPIGLLEPSWNN